jgi:hypothetical protein
MFTFSAVLEGELYNPDSPNCNFHHQEEHFWWMDFAGYKAPPLSFVKHPIVATPTPGPFRYVECHSSNDPPSMITFWTGKSAIYIGCKWNQGECDSTFTGVLYSVLIDPLNSKPQS